MKYSTDVPKRMAAKGTRADRQGSAPPVVHGTRTKTTEVKDAEMGRKPAPRTTYKKF